MVSDGRRLESGGVGRRSSPNAGAAEDLAVEGDVVPAVGVAVGQPVADDPVQVARIEDGEQVGERVGAGHVAVAEAEGVTEVVLAEAAERGDGGDARVAGRDGHQG